MRENRFQSVDTTEERGYDVQSVPDPDDHPIEQVKYYAPGRTYHKED